MSIGEDVGTEPDDEIGLVILIGRADGSLSGRGPVGAQGAGPPMAEPADRVAHGSPHPGSGATATASPSAGHRRA
jgi:hypothetical protein